MIRWLLSLFREPDEDKVQIYHYRNGVECEEPGPGWYSVKINMEIGGEIHIEMGNRPYSTPYQGQML